MSMLKDVGGIWLKIHSACKCLTASVVLAVAAHLLAIDDMLRKCNSWRIKKSYRVTRWSGHQTKAGQGCAGRASLIKITLSSGVDLSLGKEHSPSGYCE